LITIRDSIKEWVGVSKEQLNRRVFCEVMDMTMSMVLSVPDYSGDIAQAWQVVERMRELGWWLSIHAVPSGWMCEMWRLENDNITQLVRERRDTLPEAMAHCALAAIGGGE
jgi:hypothetical protein